MEGTRCVPPFVFLSGAEMDSAGSSGPIRVAICGIRGRMGQEMKSSLAADPALRVVGGCDPRPPIDGAPPADVPEAPSLAILLGTVEADAVVDFTTAEGARENAKVAL